MSIDVHSSLTGSQRRYPPIAMYRSITLGALFYSCFQPFTNAQLTGRMSNVGTETGGIVLVTIANNSTGNYSIEARNNLFDDANPYQPLRVKNLAGAGITLLGKQAAYGPLTDSAFISMSPGSVWQKVLNMTEYIPPDPALLNPTSECFSLYFPDGLFAVNTTNFVADEDLATGFLKGNTADIFITATPLHINVTVMPGKQTAGAATTATIASQEPATLIAGTASAGPGGAQPTLGSSIDSYLGGTTGIFAKSGHQN